MTEWSGGLAGRRREEMNMVAVSHSKGARRRGVKVRVAYENLVCHQKISQRSRTLPASPHFSSPLHATSLRLGFASVFPCRVYPTRP